MGKSLTGASDRRKYKDGMRKQSKAGRPPKKLHPAAQKKLERQQREAARLAQVSKLRGNDVTCEPMQICKISPSQTVATSTKTPGARKSSLKLPALPSRTTRATAAATAEAARPKRSPTDIDRYIAYHNTPTKKGNNSWNVVNNKITLLEDNNGDLKDQVKSLKALNRQYKIFNKAKDREIKRLNDSLRAFDIPEDRPADPNDIGLSSLLLLVKKLRRWYLM